MITQTEKFVDRGDLVEYRRTLSVVTRDGVVSASISVFLTKDYLGKTAETEIRQLLDQKVAEYLTKHGVTVDDKS
jgi:hypothetical protein